MSPDYIQAITSIASVLVTLAGFILINRQIKQVDKSTRGQTHSYLYTHQDSITRLFIEKPALRAFFYDDLTPDTRHKNDIVIRAVTELVADFCEHIYLQLPNLPDDIRKGWDGYMKNLYNNSPLLREHFERGSGEWYSKEFIEALSHSYVPMQKKTQ
ncbi:hypothetical protein HNV11_16580 [Spirosoma taeanense]|uniref:DUF4760 domain-containing protein n=1 Tax=Spirosoma taeanense TaxID=2735870 RepID=A0A6M5Y9D2_9BACT|nr:hypothetical protein [Spirosoma taeanense]QJW90877.1 hypothetical protein HNV11_16580 [Spirosoma taeanense]